MQEIFFIEGNSLPENIKAISKDTAKFFCDSFAAKNFLEEKGFLVQYFEELISLDDSVKIDSFSLDLAKNLCVFDGKDISIFKGVSCNQANYVQLHSYFIQLFKLSFVLQKAVETEKPKIVFVRKKPMMEKIALEICREKNVSIEFFETCSAKKDYSFIFLNLKRAFIRFFSGIYLKISSEKIKAGFNGKAILFFGVLSKWGDRIFEKLKSDGFNVVVVDMNVSHRKSLKTDVLHFKLSQFAFKETLSPDFFKKMFSDFLKKNSAGKKFYFNGIDLFPAAMAKIETVFLKDFPETAEDVLECTELLGRLEPLRIVCWSDATRKERVLVDVCGQKGIESVVMQHGVNSGFDLIEAISFYPLFAAKICVWGKKDLDFFLEKGISREKVFIVGCERCDFLNSNKKFYGKNARKELGISENAKMVVFGTQPYNGWTSEEGKHEHCEILKSLAECAEEIGNIKIVVKTHPSEFAWDYNAVISKYPAIVLQTSMEPYNLMASADLVVTRLSTIGLEGLVLEKPLMVVNFSKRKDAFPYVAEGVAVGVYSKKDLSGKLRKILFDREYIEHFGLFRKKFFENWLDGLQGKTIEKTAEVLEN